MRDLARPFRYIGTLFELGIPLVGFWFAFEMSTNFVENLMPLNIFTWLAFLSTLVAYFVYFVAVIRVNQRRFPRVLDKALFIVFLPLVYAATLGFVSEMVFETWVFVSSIHIYSALMLAMFLESVQNTRVRAFKFPRVLAGIFLVAGVMSIFLFSLIALPLYIKDVVLVETSWRLTVWFLGIFVIAYVKFFQSGRRLYAEKGYRPNAACIVMNMKGQVLLCERNDKPGTIQTVQGGIDPGESPEQAARRELVEELGIWPGNYEVKAALLNSKRYDWSGDLQRKLIHTGYKGQEQYFFLVQVPNDVRFDLNYHFREFRKVWFDDPEQLLKLAWSKKRPGIESALKGFGLIK